MPDAPRVRAANDAREQAAIALWHLQATQAAAAAQVAVNLLGEVRQLIDQKHMDLRALILDDVLLVLAVAKVDLRAVPELDEVLRPVDLGVAAFDPL